MPEETIGQKRPYSGLPYGAPPAKRPPTIRVAGFEWNLQALAQAANAVETGGKSPVSALNELGVKVNYSVLRQGGPAHCPNFTVSVTVADMTFEGWGHSKREARASAAKACLEALLARAGRVLPRPEPEDFTSDEAKGPPSDFQCLEAQAKVEEEAKRPETPPAAPPLSTAATALFGTTGAVVAHKSPINSLYETCPGLSFHCTFGDGSSLDQPQAPVQLSHSMRFKVVCQIKDQVYEGYGSSKKLAKLAAAKAALAVLDEGRAPAACAAPPGCLPQPRADTIGKLVNEKFHEIMKGDLVHSKRKVLAGIVMTIDNKPEASKVIAVTTGTKCVSGEHMSVRGRAVNDCHAEVAARRCLQRHLYAQLLMYAEAEDPTIPIPESDLEPVPGGGYQMKPDRQLHLYVSTAPCGDGRIFSPHEQPDPAPDRHPNRLARGQLRTKIESGEGTIPVKNCSNIVQTWDGVMQGERLLTMSCSDKVCRWCAVGLQGALLARLLRPVYLASLVLGSLLHPHHMYRAICGRIENQLQSLPPPFRLQRPLLARAASTEARTPARAPSFSVCWSITSPLPEIINANTGKLESGQPSLLCKQSMFARWQYLVKRLPLLPQEPNGTDLAPLPDNVDQLLYNEAKQLCPTYQAAKERLIEAFDKAKLGRWIKKPLEQDQFVCEIVDAAPEALFAWAGSAPNYNAVQRPATGDQLGGGEGREVNSAGREENGLSGEVNDIGNEKNDLEEVTNLDRELHGLGKDRNYLRKEKNALSREVKDLDTERNCLGREVKNPGRYKSDLGRDLGEEINDQRRDINYLCGKVNNLSIRRGNHSVNALKDENYQERGRNDYAIKDSQYSVNNETDRIRQISEGDREKNDIFNGRYENDKFSINVRINVEQKMLRGQEKSVVINPDDNRENRLRQLKNVCHDFSIEELRATDHSCSKDANDCLKMGGNENDYRNDNHNVRHLGQIHLQGANRSSNTNIGEGTNKHLNKGPNDTVFVSHNNERAKKDDFSKGSRLLAKRFMYKNDSNVTITRLRQPNCVINDFNSHQRILEKECEDFSNDTNCNKINTEIKTKNDCGLGLSEMKIDKTYDTDILTTKVKQLNIDKENLLPKNEAKHGSWLERFNSTQCRINSRVDEERNDTEGDKLKSKYLKKLLSYHRRKN